MKHVLVTGGTGFIGSHVVQRLLAAGDSVRVLDNFDPFYDVAIKRRNVELHREAGGTRFELVEGDIRDFETCARCVDGVDAVIHLAALAGVRPSIADPVRYMDVNVAGTQTLLCAISGKGTAGMPVVIASSSSVYGGNEKVPFAETDNVDRPVSPYAASKKATEVVAHTFHHLHGNPTTCLRFFTVFGPGQRPEMAIHQFTRKIVHGESLTLFGDGSTSRDYTFVDDVVDGTLAALDRADGYHVYNLGGSTPTTLAELVATLEDVIGEKAVIERLPEQPGDVRRTMADLTIVQRDLDYERKVPLREGIERFVAWYRREREVGTIR